MNAVQQQFEPGTQSRVTKIGQFLRKTKIDETPELINIIKGDMSIVGPRPEVPKYISLYPDDFKTILSVRPGLSDFASIKYRHEEEFLANASDPVEHYQCVILPDKLRLAREYVDNISLKTDIRIIIETLRLLIM